MATRITVSVGRQEYNQTLSRPDKGGNVECVMASKELSCGTDRHLTVSELRYKLRSPHGVYSSYESWQL